MQFVIRYTDVLGSEKKNKVRGFGAGINWSDVPGIVTEDKPISREVKKLKAAYELQLEAATVAKQEVLMLRVEATEREERWSSEVCSIVENLKKEQAEAISKQNSEMKVEIMAIKRGMIEFMAELKDSNGKGKTEKIRSIVALESLFNKVDSTHACGHSNTSTDEEYEAVSMETDEWAIPSTPQGKPNK